jgi:hypothetical protein
MKSLTSRPLVTLFGMTSAMALFLSVPGALATTGVLGARAGTGPKRAVTAHQSPGPAAGRPSDHEGYG